MEMYWRRLGMVLGVTLLGHAALAQMPDPQRPALPQGYLAPGAVDAVRIVPPAPKEGDARAILDRHVFKATRKLRGSERWALATADVALMPADLMTDFSCAAGVELTPQSAPHLAALMGRVGADGFIVNEAAKRSFKRLRPFQIQPGPICQPEAQLADSFDYPSGHTVWGWSWALVLAELVPDRATDILARGRAYGESRAVCGAHNASAVDAGLVVAASTFATLHGSAEFRTDMDAARAEVSAQRAQSPPAEPTSCAREAKIVAQPPY